MLSGAPPAVELRNRLNGGHVDWDAQAIRRRYEILRDDGVDIAPGEPWSVPCNAPLFISALQVMDDLNAAHNACWWRHLHAGSDLPN